MNYQQLGASEQEAGAIPFMSILSPTKFEYAAEQMAKILERQKHGGLVGRFLWLPFGKPEKVLEWLGIYILEARKAGSSLTMVTYDFYKNIFVSRYGYSVKDTDIYFDAFMQAVEAGYVDNVIFNPSGYSPQSTMQDIMNALDIARKKATSSLIPIVFVAVAAYAAMTVLVPKTTAAIVVRRKTI